MPASEDRGPQPGALAGVDWLGLCRRAAEAVRRELERYPTTSERAV